VTAPNSWPSFRRKTRAKVDYQVAAPTELGTPTMHRAKIAQLRVRMEGWRQGLTGSNARNPQEGKRKQKEKSPLDSYRPSHGRSFATIVDQPGRYASQLDHLPVLRNEADPFNADVSLALSGPDPSCYSGAN